MPNPPIFVNSFATIVCQSQRHGKRQCRHLFVHHAISGLRARGVDPDPVLRGAGIAPALLAVPQARVSAASYSELWMAVAAALDDEFFGQDSRSMKCGSFAMLCHAVAGSRTLGQGLERITRYFRLLLDDIGVRLERHGDEAALVLTAPCAQLGRQPGVFAKETMLIMLHGLMSWLLRRRVPVRLAAFDYDEPPYSAEYRVMYSRSWRSGSRPRLCLRRGTAGAAGAPGRAQPEGLPARCAAQRGGEVLRPRQRGRARAQAAAQPASGSMAHL